MTLNLDEADDTVQLGNWEIPAWMSMNFTHVLKLAIVAGSTPALPSTIYVWWKS